MDLYKRWHLDLCNIGWSGIVLIVGVLFTLFPDLTWADAFRNPFQSASAIAQGNAFSAQADDPSAIYYNPAGMTQLPGIQTSGGVQFINPNLEFTNPMGQNTTNDVPALVGLPPPAQFFITASLKDLDFKPLKNATLGFAVLNLFGFANKYSADGPLNTSVIRAQLPLLDLKPTAAYQIADILSVGLGADIFTFASFIGEGQAERQFVGGGNIPGTAPGQTMELNGTGTTAGLNASFLYTPMRNAASQPLVTIGFVWRSQAVLPLEGSLLADGRKVADASFSIRFPESYEWAIAAWPLRDGRREWKVEVDVDYVRWSSIRDFNVYFSNGAVLLNPQNWNDTTTIMVGTEYKWLRPSFLPAWDIAFRTGYSHAGETIPNQNFDPAIPDSTGNLFSVGAGFFCHPNGFLFGLISCGNTEPGFPWRTSMAIDLFYQAILFNDRTITGNFNPAVNGDYEMFTQGGGINLRVNF